MVAIKEEGVMKVQYIVLDVRGYTRTILRFAVLGRWKHWLGRGIKANRDGSKDLHWLRVVRETNF